MLVSIGGWNASSSTKYLPARSFACRAAVSRRSGIMMQGLVADGANNHSARFLDADAPSEVIAAELISETLSPDVP